MKRTSAFLLRLTAVLLLVLALAAGAALGESYEASTMRLLRHEGTVEIFDISGEPRFLLDNVRFVSGESLRTGGDGQASVSLDDNRIVSMAADTRVEFIQESGHMQLNLTEGSLFLDVQKKLDENESFDIQTTTMTVGIRGTLIFASQLPSGETTVGILEGGGRFTFTDTTGAKRVVDVSAGTKFVVPVAAAPEQGIAPEISPLTAADMPEYVTSIVLADEALTNRVINGSENGGQLLDPSSAALQAGISVEEPYPADGDWTWARPVTLVAQSASKLYDGKPLMRPSDTLVYGLPGNFNISVTASGSLTNAGSCDNVVASYSIYNASGENVTSHFTDIEIISGSLVVDPAPLVVWTGSAEKIYDGEPLTCSEAGIRTVPGHDPEAPAWMNSSLVTQTALGSERMVALSGRTYVHGTNPLTGESQQLALEAGQSLSVCLTGEEEDQSLEFRIENLKEEELPEEVLRVYADNPELLAQACEDTGWDPDLMASLIAALPPAEEATVISDTGLAVAGADQENLMTDSANVRIHIDSRITNYTTRALTEEEASFTPIVLDPSVVITATGSQTEVGESENTYTINWGNANPKNFVIREDLGTLVVTPLLEDQVTITGASASKVYDGTELTANRFTVSGLPEGYTVKAGVSGSVTDAGEAENKVAGYTILTADGADYTAHFPNVRLVPGTLTVTPASLTVTTGSAKKVYDGQPLTCDEAAVTGLVNNETAAVTTNGSITGSGTADNTYTISWGTAKESNYTVSGELGTLTVEALSVDVNCGGGTADYSGAAFVPKPVLTYLNGPHAGESVAAEPADISLSGSAGEPAGYIAAASGAPRRVRAASGDMKYTFSLYTGDTLTLTLSGMDTDAGSFTLTGSVSSTADSCSGISVSLSGTAVTVEPAMLTITSGSSEKAYDGTPLICEEYTVTGLADGQSLTITPAASLTDVGTADNLFTVDWGGLNKDNYTLTESYGTLTVTPAALVFDVGGTTARYAQDILPAPSLSCNGETVSPDSVEALDGTDGPQSYLAVFTLPAGDTASLTIEGFNTWNGVGTYPLTGKAAITSGNAANYTISYENTSLILEYAQLTVSTATESKTYDGTPDPLTAEATLTGDCAEYLHAAAVGDGSADAGIHENGYEIDWSGMESSQNCFMITEDLGTLTIEPIDLTFDFHCGTVTYGRYTVAPPTMNGAAPTNDTEPYTYSLPVGSETVTLSAENLLGPDTDAGDYTITYSCTFSGNSANYKVMDNGTEYTVSPWTISVQTPSVTKVYDGAPVDRSLLSYTGDDACDIRIYALGSQGSADAAEPYDNEYLIDWGSVPADKQSNYDIQVTCGTLTINPVDITFDFHCGTVTYGRYTVTPPTMNGAAPTNDTAPYTYDLPVGSETVTLSAGNLLGPDTDAGDYTITYSCAFSGNAANYNVRDNGTSYTVSPAQITIDTTSYSQSKTYDGDSFSVYTTPLPVADYPDIFYTLTEPDDVDVGTYVQDCEITDWGSEKESNFTVSITTGTLEITPKDLTITTQFALKAYDGTPLTDNTSYIEGLVDGETITVTCKGSQTLPGSSLNDFDITWVTAKEKNYNVHKQPEYLQVIKQPVTLRSASIKETNFYGTLTNGDEPLTVVEGQFYGTDFEDLEVVFTASQTGDGSTSNTFEIVENEASSHYEITTEFGNLWIDNSNMSSEG